jgi:outer membrane protein
MNDKQCFFLSIILLFLIVIFQNNSIAGDNQSLRILGLRECIVLAIKNDPDIINTQDQMGIGRIRTGEAFTSLLMPRFDLETTRGPQLDFFGNPTSDNIFINRTTIEKPIYTGGELITSYRMGQSETLRAQHDYKQKVADVTGGAIEDYYRLLATQETLRYYQEIYGRAKKALDLLKKKYEAGAVMRLELLEAAEKLNEINYRLIEAQAALQADITSLYERIGWDFGEDIHVVKEFPIEELEGNIDALVANSMKYRPDLLYEKENLKFNRLKLKLNKSDELPKLSFIGTYKLEGEDWPGDKSAWAVMLNLTYSLYNSTISSSASQNQTYENPVVPRSQDVDFDVESLKLSLFDGSSNRVDIEEARADLKLSSNRLAQLKRSLKKKVSDSFHKLQEAKAIIKTSEKSIEVAEEKLKILEEKLKLGLTTDVEILDAGMELIDFKVKNIQAFYEKSVALAGLYKATGTELAWKEN